MCLSQSDLSKKIENLWKDFLLFLKHIPSTFKESLVWFTLSYLCPLMQIFLIWAIKQGDFKWSLDIMKILLVTNASIYTSILALMNNRIKDKKVVRTLIIVSLCFTVLFFSVAVLEITTHNYSIPLSVYQYGMYRPEKSLQIYHCIFQ